MQTYFPSVTRDDGAFSLRLTIHHAIYFILLFALIGAQPVSNFMMSGMEILLAVNWALEWDMRAKWGRARRSPLLWAFLVLMAVHLIWMLWSANSAYGWYDIFKKLPLLAIPLVVLTSLPLNRKQLEFLFFTFVTTVFIATIIGRIRMATILDLPYRQIIPFISHIRFSMNVCLAVAILVWFGVERAKRVAHPWRDWLLWLSLLVMLSLLDFLFRLRSYTAFVMLFVTAVLLLVVFWRRIRNRLAAYISLVLVVLVAAVAVIVSIGMYTDYYTPVPLASQPLRESTANGNPYQHKQDGLIENGNYVNNYICRVELECEWDKCSAMSLDDITENEYAVYPTLIRYLNAMGTTKDSVGMTLLNDDDIRAIEKGIANPVYLKGSSLRKMYYVMFFEYECYRKFGAVKDFTMLQRFELWRNAWRTFLKNPLFGVGTGDVVDACHKQLVIDGSPLEGTKKHAHNQYLTFLVSFGIVGFVVIAALFVYAVRRQRLLRLPIVLAFVSFVLISFISEDTLETLAGCVFSVLFLCLMAAESGERRTERGE
ncbi:MAG: O-antigen ligase family protein [Bacteroidales bacterium]|nr:O-antigen ligase family protein [Bacteroidales bacterium]